MKFCFFRTSENKLQNLEVIIRIRESYERPYTVYNENNKMENNRKKSTIYAASSLFFVVFLFGCNSKDLKFSTTESALPRSNISVDELQEQLDEFEELFTSRIKSAASEIRFSNSMRCESSAASA